MKKMAEDVVIVHSEAVTELQLKRGCQCCPSCCSEEVSPAQHRAGPVAGALNQPPEQGGEQDHSQGQHRPELGKRKLFLGHLV